MSDFKWDSADVEKFKKCFKCFDKEIKAGDIPRKNDFRRAGRKKPDTKDFSKLMRLVVQDKSARVTSGCLGLNSYRIRMTSEEFPFKQNVFGGMDFINKCLIDPVPRVDKLLVLLPPNTIWDDRLDRCYNSGLVRSDCLRMGFGAYDYQGFDLDYMFDGASWCDDWYRESVALETVKYVRLFQLLSDVRQEISPKRGGDIKWVEEEFLYIFECNFLKHFLNHYYSTKLIKLNRQFEAVLTLVETGQPVEERDLKGAVSQEIDATFLDICQIAEGKRWETLQELNSEKIWESYRRWDKSCTALVRHYYKRSLKH